MASLDLATIALCCALNSLFYALVLYSQRNPWVQLRGSRSFGTAALCCALAYALVAYEPSGDTAWVQVLRVTASVAVYAFVVSGLCYFNGWRRPWAAIALSLVLGAGVSLAYPNQAPDVLPRVLVSALLCSGWALAGTVILLRPMPGMPRLGALCAALGLGVMALVYLLRAAALMADGRVSGAETSLSPANAPLMLMGQVSLLLGLGGLAVMWNARLVMEVSRLATHDALTGALTRRGFNAAWAGWRRQHGPGWVLLMDLDRFKALNDAQGHAAGDEALAWFAQCARRQLPTEALLARQGGDEFLALLPRHWQGPQVQALADGLLADYARGMQARWPDTERAVGVSIGYAAMGSELAESVRRADAALYRAKQAGRGQACEGQGPVPA